MTEINKSIAGFTITKRQELADCHGVMTIMQHAKTGARLCYLDRDDDNMTFSIAFKTIPQDDTGVFHILEHSVLNGSDKYPVKEPFVELLKSSMNTFLNAMTFSDKTMFPVSSRNKKDFMNLVSIYLDAVFHPSIYHNKHIFEQEGWHYEIRSKEDPVVTRIIFQSFLMNSSLKHIKPSTILPMPGYSSMERWISKLYFLSSILISALLKRRNSLLRLQNSQYSLLLPIHFLMKYRKENP